MANDAVIVKPSPATTIELAVTPVPATVTVVAAGMKSVPLIVTVVRVCPWTPLLGLTELIIGTGPKSCPRNDGLTSVAPEFVTVAYFRNELRVSFAPEFRVNLPATVTGVPTSTPLPPVTLFAITKFQNCDEAPSNSMN